MEDYLIRGGLFSTLQILWFTQKYRYEIVLVLMGMLVLFRMNR
jgi:hypothetical protein